jgi:hypothetical protein
MPTTTLLDRAERTSSELGDAARAHLTEAEEYASQAATSARLAAEHYAETLSDQFEDTVDSLRDDLDSLLEDPETRGLVIGVAVGITVTGVAVWLLRRRAKRKAEKAYEASAEGVPGWNDPRTALATASG